MIIFGPLRDVLMLSICWGSFGWFRSTRDDLLGSLCSLPTESVFVNFLGVFFNFPLHFWLLGNSMGIFENFIFLLNYM